ncbi:MAG TPA: potassium channel protein [Bacteroidetes bacterium]|nr:potassium channel protein [Bacteroidota bacterium]
MHRHHIISETESSKLSLRLAIVLLISLVTLGVIGYMILEGYSFIDALYMTIITISTVGFREVRTLSGSGKIFTTLLIIFSFGIFVFAISNLTRYLLEGIFKNTFLLKRIKKKIKKLENHIILCGYGRNGRQSAKELSDHGRDFVIIENNPLHLETLEDKQNLLVIEGDATQEETLLEAGLERAEALITTLPNDADNLLIVITARQFNPGMTIISRASDERAEKKLKRAGATNVIMSDKIGGQRMAKLVVQPDVVEFLEKIMLQSSFDVNLEDISCEEMCDLFDHKSIRDLGIRNKSGANIIGMKKNGEYLFNPDPDVLLDKSDKLFVLGKPDQITLMKKLLQQGEI